MPRLISRGIVEAARGLDNAPHNRLAMERSGIASPC